MPEGQPYHVVRQDEDDDLDSLTMTTSFIQGQNGHTNHHAALPGVPGMPQSPRWARSRKGSRTRASSIRLLLFTRKARTAVFLALFALLLGLAFWSTTTKQKPTLPATPEPNEPIFKHVLELERALPQHNPDLPFPEGRKGRYINFSGHAWGSGWNNVVQEHLVTAHLALLTRRAYVFPPHIARDHRPFPDVPNLSIPFTAFGYGPITGTPFAGSRGSPDESRLPQDKILPRAVSEEYFHSVCSEEETVKLPVIETSSELGVDVDQDDALTIMLAWAKKLAAMEEPCVDVSGRSLFLYLLFGSPQVLPVWSMLAASPIYKDWDWSPLIHSTLEANGIPPPSNSASALVRKSLPPTHPWAIKERPIDSSGGLSAETRNDRVTESGPYVIQKLVAVHVRRGDYEGHCRWLGALKASWTSWNALGTYSRDNATLPEGFDPEEFKLDARFINASYPKLPDSLFDPPYSVAYPHDEEGRVDPTTLTRENLAFLHCWPRMDAIRDKLAAVRRARPGLENVYLMTNGEERWVGGLIELLLEDGWKSIRSSKELVLGDAALAVSQGVDMAVGNWAEVFVGNGFSSMTSNVVGFRLAQGHPPDSIYFF